MLKPNYKYRFVFACRPIQWIFRRDWYSLYRWRIGFDPQYDCYSIRVIDIGMFTIGISRQVVNMKVKE